MKHLSISILVLVLLLLLAVSNASRLDTSPENHDNHDDNLLNPTETNLPQLNPTTWGSHVVVDLMNRRPVYHHNRFNKFPRRCHHHHHRSGSTDEVVELEIISSLKDYRRKHLRSNPKYGYDRRRGKVDDDTVEVKEEEYKGDDEWKGGRPYRHHHHDHDHDHDHDDHDHGHDHHDKYYKRPEIVKRIRKFLSHYLNW